MHPNNHRFGAHSCVLGSAREIKAQILLDPGSVLPPTEHTLGASVVLSGNSKRTNRSKEQRR